MSYSKPQSRREFLRGAGLGLGLTCVPSLLRGQAPRLWIGGLPGGNAPAGNARADAVIQVFLQGGLSHLDTFDPKPDAPVEVRGELDTVASRIDGERFTTLMRRTAAVADRLTVIRSMTHTEADHGRGTHNMLTGYPPSPAITYPSMGSVAAHELGIRNDLPPYVAVANQVGEFLGTGYLSAANAPFLVGGNPTRRDFRVQDLTPPEGVDETRVRRRRRLLHDLDKGFHELGADDAVVAGDAFYEQAYALIESESARAAFDLRAEENALVERYGTTRLGQRMLLARRLVEGGVRYVTVYAGGFDHHARIYRALPGIADQVDRAFSSLVEDLDDRGMLDRTLVLLTTEFGRTPRLNQDGGRDHWPRVFSTVLAGGGIKRGHVHGRSDAGGAEPAAEPVSPGDLAATAFTLLGIDPHKKLMAPGDRPIDIVRGGRVIDEVIA